LGIWLIKNFKFAVSTRILAAAGGIPRLTPFAPTAFYPCKKISEGRNILQRTLTACFLQQGQKKQLANASRSFIKKVLEKMSNTHEEETTTTCHGRQM